MLIPMLTGSITATSQDDPPEGLAPGDIWSEDYANDVYPWGGNDRIQFKAYHDYFTMRDRMMEIIRRLAGEEGIGIMLIEHVIDLVMSGSDIIVVLNSGELIAEGPPEEVRQNREVLEAYLGHV